jgi:LacI family transcriptional regulator
MSTIREIARELNLSHTTVSRVLNTRNDQAISSVTRERIRETALRMGYRPHFAARALATGTTRQIALVMRHLYTAFHAQIVHEVEQALRKSGYGVTIATVDWSQETTGSPPVLQQVDGCLAFETGARINDLLANQKSAGKATPLVAMGGHHLGEGPDRVGFDLGAGTDDAMAHLLATGRRRIAHVTHQSAEARADHYRAAMEGAGLMPELLITPTQKREDSREAVRESLSVRLAAGVPLPDALFCFNDEVAIGAYRGVRDLGLRIGADVAIVGFDGIEDAACLDTAITTVALPVAAMCASAWELLQRRIADGEAPPQQRLLRPTLIVRESSAAPTDATTTFATTAVSTADTTTREKIQ